MPLSLLASAKLPGLFRYYSYPIELSHKLQSMTLPQSITQFPFMLLLTTLISNLLKVAVPFVLQYLYINISINNILQPVSIFILTIVLSYYFELKAQQLLTRHKLRIKSLLCRRVIQSSFFKPYSQLQQKSPTRKLKQQQDITCWSKISANINIFVNNYYTSYLTVIFQTLKAIVIVIYLFNKLGLVVLVGLFVGGCITQFILFISKNIQQANFRKLKTNQKKVNILTQYFTRIVDYQMSWLDGFVGDRIESLQNQYQRNLRKVKMLDAWCVGLWQFTQIGISSVVLCLYYYVNAQQNTATGSNNSESRLLSDIQPATIIYLFQMLTFPMNAISWNISGLRNAQRAILQLSQHERSVPNYLKKLKSITKYDYGYEVEQIYKRLKPNRIYSISSQDANLFKKIALYISNKDKSVSYAQQNGFLLPTVLQNLQMETVQYLDPNQLRNKAQQIINALTAAKCEELPMQNQTSTFSGGEKMRLSLARALLHGKQFVIIDSDLTSLDRITRNQVLSNIRQFMQVERCKNLNANRNSNYSQISENFNQNEGSIILIKGKKGDQGIDKFVNQYVRVQGKYTKVFFEQNKQIRATLSEIIDCQLQKQKSSEGSIIQQKIMLEISKLLIFKGLSNAENLAGIFGGGGQKLQNKNGQINNHDKKNSSSKNNANATPNLPKKMAKKLKLSLQTLKFYYHFKISHIQFILALASMYAVGNYYNYYVNVQKPTNPIHYSYNILVITVVYIICIIFRSLLFATSNLKQSQRISSLTNNLLIYNHISFYDKLNIIQRETGYEIKDEKQQEKIPIGGNHNVEYSQENSLYRNTNTQKLVCMCTSDQITVNNNFPFSTNILWNNIATVIASLIMVYIQVPIMVIFTIMFVYLMKNLQSNYRNINQSLIMNSKQQEIKLMKAVNYIDQGGLNLLVFKKKQKFISLFEKQLQENIQNLNKQSCLSVWIQSNYRVNMLGFLVLAIGLFWVSLSYQSQGQTCNLKAQNQSTTSAKMSVMVRYILLLANYTFYLTMSLAECRGQAISIERIRRFAQNINVIGGSFQRLKRSKHKRQSLIKSLQQDELTKNKQFVNLRNFSYQYDKRYPLVLQNINLRIKQSDKVILKGKTGSGKTTLFKIIMGLYPDIYFPQSTIHLISFSSQHPLKMGQCSIMQKLDPYRILELVPVNIKKKVMNKIAPLIQKCRSGKHTISYEQQVLINNLRGYLYGYKGLAVYDEPQFIEEDSSTYIVVTHHGQFKYTMRYKLEKGMLFQMANNQ